MDFQPLSVKVARQGPTAQLIFSSPEAARKFVESIPADVQIKGMLPKFALSEVQGRGRKKDRKKEEEAVVEQRKAEERKAEEQPPKPRRGHTRGKHRRARAGAGGAGEGGDGGRKERGAPAPGGPDAVAARRGGGGYGLRVPVRGVGPDMSVD
eukprot:3414852-Rhodomonas_salina.1